MKQKRKLETTSEARKAQKIGLETAKYREQYLADSKNQLITQTLANIYSINLFINQKYLYKTYRYNCGVDRLFKPQNQEYTSLCWLYGALNYLRYIMPKNLNLPANFELSASYLYFYDKLERANMCFDNFINDPNQSLENLKFCNYFLSIEAGFWNFFVNLIEKYGIVPKSVFDTPLCLKNSTEFNFTYKCLLCKSFEELRAIVQDYNDKSAIDLEIKLKQYKTDVLMPEFYKLLANSIGLPPINFNWCFYDQEQNYQVHHKLTPMSFYELFIAPYAELKSKIVITDMTTNPHFYSKQTDKLITNMINKYTYCHYYLPTAVIKEILIKSLSHKNPVLFNADIGRDCVKCQRLLDPRLFNPMYEYNKTNMNRYEFIDNHSMLLIRLDLKVNKPRYWLAENSWPLLANQAESSYINIADCWLDKYGFYYVVDRKFIPAQELTKLN